MSSSPSFLSPRGGDIHLLRRVMGSSSRRQHVEQRFSKLALWTLIWATFTISTVLYRGRSVRPSAMQQGDGHVPNLVAHSQSGAESQAGVDAESMTRSFSLRDACRWDHDPPVVLITSSGSRLLNAMEQPAVLESFARHQATLPAHNAPPPLVLFNENSWDVAHKRQPVSQSQLPDGVCSIDAFVAQPWLNIFIKPGGAADSFYDYAGAMEPCDQPLKIKSGSILARKVAAMDSALRRVPTNTTIVWIDTDVVLRAPLDETFMAFVRAHDITYIPFTTNKLWGDTPRVDFNSLDDPFWRIESGVVALTASATTRRLISDVIEHYNGKLLRRVKQCLQLLPLLPHHSWPCNETWFQRNVYLDDIFVFSLVLHEYKAIASQGWFSVGHGQQCSGPLPAKDDIDVANPYPFPHVCRSQTPYSSSFNLERYFEHQIGSGAYSKVFRHGASSAIDAELMMSPSQLFNDSLEWRFPGATPKKLHDEMWDMRTLQKRRDAGLWPWDRPLTLEAPERIKAAPLALMLATGGGTAAPLWHVHPLAEMDAENGQCGTLRTTRGAVVILSQNKAHSSYHYVRKLTMTLDLLFAHYNEAQGNDVIICHEGDFDAEAQQFYTNKYKGLRFFLLTGNNWAAVPPSAADRRSWVTPSTWPPFGVGYRKMIRWWFVRVWPAMHALGYTHVMRLDDDSFLLSRIPYNVFDFMASAGFTYAYRNIARESGETDGQFYAFVRRYYHVAGLNSTGWLLDACPGATSIADFTPSFCGEMFGVYNNFFVSEVAFWMREDVQHFINSVDRSGRMFTHRWNDLILQSVAVQLFCPRERVHRFLGWGYAHFSAPLERKSHNYGLMQAGVWDVDPMSTLLSFGAAHDMNVSVADLTLRNGAIVTFGDPLYLCSDDHGRMCLS